jgi:hypothetical protein
MIKQDENGIFRVFRNVQIPVGSQKLVMKHGDTVAHLDNWEDCGAGLVAESVKVIQKQTSANGKSYTSTISVTEVHYSQKTVQDDNQIRRRKGSGLDIRMGVESPNEKTMDRSKPIPIRDFPRPGSDWQIEKPGD